MNTIVHVRAASFTAFASLLAIVTGCAMDAAPAPNATEEGPPEGAELLAHIGGEGPHDVDGTHTAAFGGSGGSQSWIACPNVVGILGRAGGYIDNMQLLCESTNRFPTQSVGGGGGAPFNSTCPTGFFATGVQGSAGKYLDRLGVICSDANNNVWTGWQAGGGGGYPFRFDCAANKKIVGFVVRSGGFIDSIDPYCGAR